MGASSSDTDFSTCAGILSGPRAFFGLISGNNLYNPGVVILISGIIGMVNYLCHESGEDHWWRRLKLCI